MEPVIYRVANIQLRKKLPPVDTVWPADISVVDVKQLDRRKQNVLSLKDKDLQGDIIDIVIFQPRTALNLNQTPASIEISIQCVNADADAVMLKCRLKNSRDQRITHQRHRLRYGLCVLPRLGENGHPARK